MHSEDSDPALPDDPFSVAARRTSVAGAGIDVLVFDAGDPARGELVGSGLVQLIRSRQRPAEFRVLPARSTAGLGPTLETAVATACQDLILVTSATRPWTAAHLDPLLVAIETSDHAIGRRPAAGVDAAKRWLDWAVRSLLYAVPIVDLHSPCRLHRREPLSAIAFQSESAFVDLELLAKATFLGHVLVEVEVPELPADDDERRWALWRHDRRDLWRKPLFRRPVAAGASTPAEPAEREKEGDERPGGQDQERGSDLDQAGTLQDHFP
jgi:hypothetical protein